MYCVGCGHLLSQPAYGDATTVSMSSLDQAPASEQFVIEELAGSGPVLIVKDGPEQGTLFQVEEDLVCGRDPNSDVFLNDVTVSRKHARIVRESDHFLLEDLWSLNGTFLNRQRVQTAELNSGDEIQIGKFRLVFYSPGR